MPTTTRIVTAALVLASACGEAKKTEGTPSASGVAGESKSGASAGRPKQGGYVVIPSPEPTILNPVLHSTSAEVTPLVFEGLIALDAKLEPTPRLAEKWETADGGKVITFHLRKN